MGQYLRGKIGFVDKLNELIPLRGDIVPAQKKKSEMGYLLSYFTVCFCSFELAYVTSDSTLLYFGKEVI